eukprot:4502226-Prymnesium_polylepis.1
MKNSTGLRSRTTQRAETFANPHRCWRATGRLSLPPSSSICLGYSRGRYTFSRGSSRTTPGSHQ